MNETANQSTTIALTWCLAWGARHKPQYPLELLQQMREALRDGKEVPIETRSHLEKVQQLQSIPHDYRPEKLTELQAEYSNLCQETTRIGLVYGGVTKVKQYVFEAAKLSEIRGASALLDKINLVDLPAFFSKHSSQKIAQSPLEWLEKQDNFPELAQALIPELVIYSTGGNILAFCPAAFVDDLADAIEKRYTYETITANSCAVGDTFRLIEIRFGAMRDNLIDTPWFDWYRNNKERDIVKAYFEQPDITDEKELFFSRKSFNELTGKLASKFQQRRAGNATPNRSSRCYPTMLETHPYLIRDGSDRASAIMQARLPNEPYFSEPLARKRFVGQIAKRDKKTPKWYQLEWQPDEGEIKGWVTKFDEYLLDEPDLYRNYYGDLNPQQVEESQTLLEIGDRINGFVAFLYADGNNMGGYIQKAIKTPEDYQEFSIDIFEATEKAVYIALAKHLKPHKLKHLPKQKESRNQNGDWIHPFEIITIGGDDVMLIVPADKALAIAYTIGTEFENILLKRNAKYRLNPNPQSALCHRYIKKSAQPSQCILSTSIGVLISSSSTPIYYAEKLTNQLLKSAKKKAKSLKSQYQYHGGTVDFLTLKSVTAISSEISKFREVGLTVKQDNKPTLKLYATPYTLHELAGLLETLQALQESNFPRSQLYQVRGLLAQGKNTAILNYRYFRVRMTEDKQKLLEDNFEKAWCEAKSNNGNVAPWMYDKQEQIYETIWRELIDLYPFFDAEIPVNAIASNQIHNDI